MSTRWTDTATFPNVVDLQDDDRVPVAVAALAPGQQQGSARIAALRNRLSGVSTVASADPTVDDDKADGYRRGSLWLNDVSADVFVCLDATEGAADWQAFANVGPGALDDLTDVDTSGATTGDVLTFDGADWAPAAPTGGGGATALDDLTDVDTAGVANGDVLAYDSGTWVPVTGAPLAYAEGVYTATMVPETSGSITLDATNRQLSYVRVGNVVTVQGVIVVASKSSPIGTYVGITLPYRIAELAGLAGRFGGYASTLYGGAATALRFHGVEGESVVRVLATAATWATNDNIWLTFSYRTDEP